MMFQIWNYYFSLVEQMDDMTFDIPRLHAIFRLCNDSGLLPIKWHVESCVRYNSSSYTCFFSEKLENTFMIEGAAATLLNETSMHISVSQLCSFVKIWILPW